MPIPTTLAFLGDLLAEGFSKSNIRRAFSRFECERDADVAFFLKAHAIQNEVLTHSLNLSNACYSRCLRSFLMWFLLKSAHFPKKRASVEACSRLLYLMAVSSIPQA